jgi:hypothetical protein
MSDSIGGGGIEQPTDNTMALATLMRDWLRAFASDAGTGVDSGLGFGECDLWVQFGGEDIHIRIKSRNG